MVDLNLKYILPLILSFILFICSAYIGAMAYVHMTQQTIRCPLNENGETFIQSMSDGNEVLCIYTKTIPQHKKLTYKKGTLQ